MQISKHTQEEILKILTPLRFITPDDFEKIAQIEHNDGWRQQAFPEVVNYSRIVELTYNWEKILNTEFTERWVAKEGLLSGFKRIGEHVYNFHSIDIGFYYDDLVVITFSPSSLPAPIFPAIRERNFTVLDFIYTIFAYNKKVPAALCIEPTMDFVKTLLDG